jgi:hypothetical protein
LWDEEMMERAREEVRPMLDPHQLTAFMAEMGGWSDDLVVVVLGGVVVMVGAIERGRRRSGCNHGER